MMIVDLWEDHQASWNFRLLQVLPIILSGIMYLMKVILILRLEVFQTREITFVVDMSNETVDIANGGARIIGSFTGGTDVAMTNNFDGTYEYSTTLRQGETVTYNYQNGTGNTELSDNLGDCGVG